MKNDRPDKPLESAGQPESADQSEVRPRNIVIEMGPPPTFNITCYGFHVWAEEFHAAEKLYARPRAKDRSCRSFSAASRLS